MYIIFLNFFSILNNFIYKKDRVLLKFIMYIVICFSKILKNKQNYPVLNDKI